MSVVVSFRISKRLKREMDRLKHVNWSAVVRDAIATKVAKEKHRLFQRRKDFARIRRAAQRIDALARRVEGWSAVAEIRRWHETR